VLLTPPGPGGLSVPVERRGARRRPPRHADRLPGFDQYRALLPELKLQLVLIGYQERSRRSADRFARRSLVVALIALAVAVISLGVSIILAL
jgi:hypothetical protein